MTFQKNKRTVVTLVIFLFLLILLGLTFYEKSKAKTLDGLPKAAKQRITPDSLAPQQKSKSAALSKVIAANTNVHSNPAKAVNSASASSNTASPNQAAATQSLTKIKTSSPTVKVALTNEGAVHSRTISGGEVKAVNLSKAASNGTPATGMQQPNTGNANSAQSAIEDRFNNKWSDVTPSNALALASQNFKSGPFTLATQYSELGGIGISGQIANAISPYNAFAINFEVAEKEGRVSGTYGQALTDHQRVKFTGEYLTQNMDFNFKSGPVKTWVGQEAFGASYEYVLLKSFVKDVNLNAFYSRATSKELTSLPMDIGNIHYMNDRRIAGGRDRGVSGGMDFLPTKSSLLGFKVNYDELTFDKKYEANTENASGVNFSVNFEQLLSKFLKLKASFEGHQPYNLYQAGISWLMPVKAGDSAEVVLTGEHTQGKGSLPRDSGLALGVNYRFGSDPSAQPASYSFDSQRGIFGDDLASWTAVPAVYMPMVLALKDERLRVVADKAFSIDGISPASCYSADYCLTTITINGGDLAPEYANGVNVKGGLVAAKETTFNKGLTAASPPVVMFGTVQSPSVKVVDTNHIEATAPVQKPGSVDVTIKTANGRTATVPAGFIYLVPEANLLNTTGRLLNGDRLVAIKGKGLDSDDNVIFDEKRLSGDDVLNMSEDHISFFTHSRTAAATAKIYISDPRHKTDPIDFTYRELNISPTHGIAGTQATITGAGFVKGRTTVKFGDDLPIDQKKLTFSDDGTTITFAIPESKTSSNPTTVGVLVTNPLDIDNKDPDSERSGDYASVKFQYDDADAPSITSIDPSDRLTNDTRHIHIHGDKFNAKDTVIFNGTSIPLDSTPVPTTTDVYFTSPNLGQAQGVKLHIHDESAKKESNEVTLNYHGLKLDPAAARAGDDVVITADDQKAAVFDGDGVTVTFDKTVITPPVTAARIVVKAPPKTGESDDVTVRIKNKSGDYSEQVFHYLPPIPVPPHIYTDKVVSLTGGGKTVHVDGSGFSDKDVIRFEDQPTTDIKIHFISSSQIEFTSIKHAAGALKFYVYDSDSKLDSNHVQFTYYDLVLDPTEGSMDTDVDIKTNGAESVFDTDATVTFDGQAPKTIKEKDTKHFKINPPDLGEKSDVVVKVTNKTSGDSGTQYFHSHSSSKPEIEKIVRNGYSPAIVLTGGGDIADTAGPEDHNIYIQGKNITKDNIASVLIDDVPSKFEWSSEKNEIKIKSVPAHAVGVATVKIITKGGQEATSKPGFGIAYTDVNYKFIPDPKYSADTAEIDGGDETDLIVIDQKFRFSKQAHALFGAKGKEEVEATDYNPENNKLHLIVPAYEYGDVSITVYNGEGITAEHATISKPFPYHRVYISCPANPAPETSVCPDWHPDMKEVIKLSKDGHPEKFGINYETKADTKIDPPDCNAGEKYGSFARALFTRSEGSFACSYEIKKNDGGIVKVRNKMPIGKGVKDIWFEDENGRRLGPLCEATKGNTDTCRLYYTKTS